MVIDQNARIQYVSPSVEQILGFSPEQLIGKDTWDLLLPEERKKYIFKGILYLNLTDLPNLKSYKHFSMVNDISTALERNELQVLYQQGS